jgi:ectoine hydroxylase-related dioxygenase (phytanoyl-CoA dioxygenase family)
MSIGERGDDSCKGHLIIMEKKRFYSEQGYSTLQRGLDFRDVGLDLIKFAGEDADLIRQGKDHGAQKVNKTYLQSHFPVYAEFLQSSQIVARCEEIVGHRLHPYNLMHLISDSQTKAMPWHRDSYIHRGMQIGPKPATVKLAIYITATDKSSGATGFLHGSFRQSINNRYLDYLMTLLRSHKAVYPTHKPGDAAIWDGEVMHHRPKNGSQYREAVIFNLSRSSDFVQKHLEVEGSLLWEYTDRL